MPEKIKTIKLGTYTWYNLHDPDKKDLARIANQFDLPHTYLKETVPSIQRGKFIKKDNYIFIVQLYPCYKKHLKKILRREIDFFIGKDFFITIHEESKLTNNLFSIIEKDKETKDKYTNHPEVLLRDIIKNSLELSMPVLNAVSKKLVNLNDTILDIDSRSSLYEILEIKNYITSLKKIMQSQQKIMNRFTAQSGNLIKNKRKLSEIFKPNIEMAIDIWDNLEIYDQSINSLQQTYESAATFKLNRIMKILTVFSVIFIPNALITSILGMKNIPVFLQDAFYFWTFLGIMLICDVIIFAIFKKLKWI